MNETDPPVAAPAVEPNVSGNAPDPAVAAPRGRRGRRALWWLGGLAIGGVALVAGARLIWHSPDTLPWVLARVPGLQADGVQGSLAGGDLRAQHIHWTLPSGKGDLTITGLALKGVNIQPWWQPALHGGAWALLTLQSLQADTLHYRSGPPSAPPTNLRLPVQVTARDVAIGQLTINDLPAASGVLGSAELGTENGARHLLQLRSAQLERASLNGQIQLGTDAPMPLVAAVQAQGAASAPWQATVNATGPLARLQVEAQVRSEARESRVAPAAQASATVATWAAWPLAALQLRVQQFDLASLSARLPETSLDGQAEVKSTGLNQPADMQIQLRNSRAGRIDLGRLPVASLAATLAAAPGKPGHVDVRGLLLQLAEGLTPAGSVTGQGQWRDGVADLALQLQDVQPMHLDSRSAAVRASGALTLHAINLVNSTTAAGAAAQPQLTVTAKLSGQASNGRGLPLQLTLDADASADRVLLRQAKASAGDAQAQLAGLLQRAAGGWRWQGSASLDRFDPQPWWRGADGSAWRQGPHRLNGQLKADLHWHAGTTPPATMVIDRLLQQLSGTADLTLAPSVLAGQPLSGELHLASQAAGLRLRGALQAAGNALTVDGQGGGTPTADHWQLKVQGPQLAALAPIWRVLNDIAPGSADWLPVAGQVEGSAVVDGRWPALRTTGNLQARGWHSKAARVERLDATWTAGESGSAPSTFKLDADDLDLANQHLDHVEAQLNGSLADHRLRLLIDSKLRPPTWTETLLGATGSGTRLEAEGHGTWTALTSAAQGPSVNAGSRWRIDQLQLTSGARGLRDARTTSHPWMLAKDLVAELQLAGGGRLQSLRLDPGRVQLLSTGLRWSQAEWRAGAAGADQLDLTAELETLAIAPVLQKLQPAVGWGGDLTLTGRIGIHQGATVDADVVLERLGGDLQVTDELGSTQALGLSELRLALSAHDGLWQFAEGFAGSQIGQLGGAQVIRSTPTARWPAAGAPLQGVLEANVAKLGVWGLWVPPGWRLSGSLHTSASVAGSVGAPEISGQVKGQGLGARNVLQGIVLSEGELAMSLTGERARIERLRFKGGEGTLDLSGDATLGSAPSARLQVLADHFRLLGRIDRRVVTSGQAEVLLDRQRLKVDGKFTLDEGLFDISQGDAPSLDSDVVVIPREGAKSARAADERPAPSLLPAPLRNAEVAVVIDLGQALKLRGRGVDTGLRGELRVSSPGGQMALNGTVRAIGGNYAAYGQKLEITRGEIVFTGAVNNPRLDVLALRPNTDVPVGVAITGTALSPRIRLHSEPDLPEMDKLSWLVLGRAPDGLGRSDTALLQRAAVALLAGEGKAPTDELLGALGITDFSVRQSDGTVRETIVSLGRQLSRRWYVGYERSLNATTGTWQLIYRVAQRFTLRAQTGETTAFDMIWSWRFD